MAADCGLFSLKDKVIVVTGGTKRYGYHFCEALADAGGTVALTSRDRKRAEETAAAFRSKGLNVCGYSLEQGEDDSIEDFVQSVIRDHGKIDVLVNSARRIPQRQGGEITREELEKQFAVNCVGLILLTRRVVEEMKTACKGNIINIGSIYGMGGQDLSIYEDPDKNTSHDYPIQKGGIIAYTKQLATTLAQHGIRANCLTLGGLRGTEPPDSVFLKRYCKKVPLGRMADGEDAKGPIVFLASDASAYMTGANLIVDGGWTAW